MVDKEKVFASIVKAVDEINKTLLKEEPLEKNPDTVLVGEVGKMDSLGIVSFITAVEQNIEEDFGVLITLASERALSKEQSPFSTIGSLVNYVSELLEENSNG